MFLSRDEFARSQWPVQASSTISSRCAPVRLRFIAVGRLGAGADGASSWARSSVSPTMLRRRLSEGDFVPDAIGLGLEGKSVV